MVVFGLGGASPALASCAQINNDPDHYVCDTADGAYAVTPDGGPWAFLTAGSVDTPLTPFAGTGTITINNSNNLSGTFQMNDPSSLNVDNAHAFLLNGGTGAANTVTLNIGGDIDTTGGSDGNYDGMRLNGWTLDVNVLGTSSIIGADDGIVVLQATNGVTLDVANGASVTGTNGNGTNGGDGVLVAVNGAPGEGGQIAGFVTVDNHGNVTGDSDLNTGPTTSGGAALNLSAAGAITVTNESDGTLKGSSGVYANGHDNIFVTNYGNVQTTKSTGAGVYFEYTGEDSSDFVTIKNLSTASLFGVGDGIVGGSNGAPVLIYNGDGEAPNPDGLIDVTGVGIGVENTNGAPITVYNGFSSDSQSQIFAGGKYGIYARTRGDGVDDGINTVDVFNYGLVEAWGQYADAAVYERSSGDEPGYVAFYNGATAVGMEPYNPNARVNAYGITPDPHSAETGDTANGSDPQIHDADGVVLVKHGNEGTLPLDIYYDGKELGSDYPFGAVVKNYGVWDFSRPDDYLTPGFADGKAGFGYVGTTGGIYAPGGKAIKIRYTGDDTGDTGIWNYGTVIGQGSRHDPVIDIRTTYNSSLEQDGQIADGSNFIYIYNDRGRPDRQRQHTLRLEYLRRPARPRRPARQRGRLLRQR